MNRTISAALLLCAGIANAGDFLQASSTITQCPGPEPTVVEIDVVDGAEGITLGENKITINEAGTYLIVAAPQVGREGDGPMGCFDLWLRVNGSDVSQFQRAVVPGRRKQGQGRHYFARNSSP